MTRLRTFKAFTLIELIVVVIIIGILAAVAAVAYNQFIGNAQKSAAQADAASTAKALNANAAADTTANGDALAYTKGAQVATVAKLSTTSGVAAARLLKTTAGAVLVDLDVSGMAATGFFVGSAAHNCPVTYVTSGTTPIATVTTASCT